MPVLQVPSIILPILPWTGPGVTGLETETVNDLLEHTSTEFGVDGLQEKIIHISATELVVVGVPGNLLCWVELSPVLSTLSAAYWAAIGGGGGAIAPTTPAILVATGVSLTTHTLTLPWTNHSPFARLVVQTPVAAAPATAFWLVQAMVSGKAE